MSARLKLRAPAGLLGRAALILVAPIATVLLIVSVFFGQRHFDDVTRQLARGVVLELRYVLEAARGAADPVAAAAAAAVPFGHRVEAAPPDAAGTSRRDFLDLSGRVAIEVLKRDIPGVRSVDLRASETAALILVGLGDGLRPAEAAGAGVILFTVERDRLTATNPHQVPFLMFWSGLILTGIAFLFLRAQLDPIARLAAAAEAFGKGRTVPFRPRGATEVRAAGAAFLEMRARIERQIEQRTLLLSGVSHDLRTPLTRLRLGLALIGDDPEVAALERDVAEMERMLDAFLAFVRGDATETATPADAAALVARAVEDARRLGQSVDYAPPPGPVVLPLRADAVGRAVTNLIGNAARHAARARVAVESDERTVRIVVEDDGPGIPRERRDEAMRPFTRLDGARDPNRGGGIGLGLAIAADVARSHGGSLRLGDSARLGGLCAELVLSR
jgi:two-component system osmolarity sensor histidine kinase EnvZ